MKRVALLVGVSVLILAAMAPPAAANHSWGRYHWGRTSNPFTLKLGDNVSAAWDSYLSTTSSDWSASSVLDTTIVAGGTTGATCAPTSGRIEVCNAAYGDTGWLGVAQIWIVRQGKMQHITQAVAKMNDTYFTTDKYDTPAWRNLVMCQEVAHAFGLDHQDETHTNANLGSCMDYTNDPDGPPSNEHPNAHDFEQLETIYSHKDSSTTVSRLANRSDGSVVIRRTGRNTAVVTHIFWTP